MFDLIFVTEEGEITILYNKLIPMGPKSENLCNNPITTAQVAEKVYFENYPFNSNQDILKGQLESWSDKYVYKGVHPSLPRDDAPGVPGRIRVLDLDQDSFPDLIFTLNFLEVAKQEISTRTVILSNVSADPDNTSSQQRMLQHVSKNDENPISKIIKEAGNTAEFITGIDIDEDGSLDIILQKYDAITKTPTIVMLYNSVVTDSFFMKALMLNSEQLKTDNIYTDNTIGPSFRFVITDTSDNKLVIASSQAYQSGYMSLQMPYAFMGIGRSNNYIETFTASTTANGKRAKRMWTPIIPNS